MLFLHEFDFLEEIEAKGKDECCGYREFGLGKGLDFLGMGVDQIAHQAEGAVAVHFVSGACSFQCKVERVGLMAQQAVAENIGHLGVCASRSISAARSRVSSSRG